MATELYFKHKVKKALLLWLRKRTNTVKIVVNYDGKCLDVSDVCFNEEDGVLSIDIEEVFTIGYRAKIKKGSRWYSDTKKYPEIILVEMNSSGGFAFSRVKKGPLKKYRNTHGGGGAWIYPEDLRLVDKNIKENLEFHRWHSNEYSEDYQ